MRSKVLLAKKARERVHARMPKVIITEGESEEKIEEGRINVENLTFGFEEEF